MRHPYRWTPELARLFGFVWRLHDISEIRDRLWDPMGRLLRRHRYRMSGAPRG